MALDLSDVVNDLLGELCNSNDYEIQYETGGSEDPVTGRYTPGTVETIKIPSAMEDIASITLTNSENIKTGDVFLMLPPSVIVPNEEYWVNVRGKKFSVESTMPFVNGGVLQYTELQLRSA